MNEVVPVRAPYLVTSDQSHSAREARPRVVEYPVAAWSTREGRVLTPDGVASHYTVFAHAREAERPFALQVTRYDPGSAVYRYHSAANVAESYVDLELLNVPSVPFGTSALVRFEHSNPHCDLRQYDGARDRDGVSRLFDTADVVHVHMDFSTLDEPQYIGRFPDRARQLLIRHYHGSQPSDAPDAMKLVQRDLDDAADAVHIGARLYHQRLSDRMHWLPIPVPVYDYAALRAQYWRPIEQRDRKVVRIAHSPTHPRIKGTVVLQTVMENLHARNLPVELVLIMNLPHAEALALKATCDITFDSFWLGMQGSGLEAACMGQAVVAGDRDVKAEYERAIGECPYSFAYGYDELGPLLERLVVDAAFRQQEADRAARYVRQYHDYPVVGRRYWEIVHHERQRRGMVHAEAA